MIKVGIIGGAGYTGGEACRILINHPEVELVYVHSTSNGGNYLSDVHTDLLGDTQMKFSTGFTADVDVMFLCVGHGDARKFLELNKIPDSVKVIDLSHDFRLNSKSNIGDREFVYGLSEVSKESIKSAKNIANPGCFATALQLGLIPLAAANKLNSEIHISAITGSTGAGQSLSQTSHFTWRLSNMSTYKCFTHQHLFEIGETLTSLQPTFDKDINFVPYRGDFARGIIASIYVESDMSVEDAVALYKSYYENAPFVTVSDKTIHLKQVVNTNKCILHVTKHGNKLLITSVIDNLLKGASGQAIQNMNIMFGLDEMTGLKLKSLAF